MQKFLCLCLFLCGVSTTWGQDLNWEQYKQSIWKIHSSIPGWCSQEKAEKLMNLIYEVKPVQCVEIGALAGAASFPMACALNFLRHGTLHSIDAWDHQAFFEGLAPDDPHLTWWPQLNINMDETYQFFIDWVTQLQLKPYCVPIRMRSDQAVQLFADHSIDLLYLDGNISTNGSLRDAMLYLPKMKEGGYIWLNLAELDTKNKTVAFLIEHCEWIKEKSIGIHCLLFRVYR